MSKILAFLSSPRENGYTTQLVCRVLDGVKSAGGEIVIYNLNEAERNL